MPPENKKIAFIAGALLVASFLNFQVNSYENLTALTGPGVIDLWNRFLGPKKYPEPDPLQSQLDDYAKKTKGAGYKNLSVIISGKNFNYKKIYVEEGNFIIYYFARQYKNMEEMELMADLVGNKIGGIYSSCLENLGCASQIDYNEPKFIVLVDDSREYELIGGKSYACFISTTNVILINLDNRFLKSDTIDISLPHELSHLILENLIGKVAEGFNEGMSCRAELIKRSFSPVGERPDGKNYYSSKQLLLQKSIPGFFDNASSYEQATSLVDFLIYKIGSKKKAAQLEKELTSSWRPRNILKKYGFNDFSDLDKRWYDWARSNN